MTARTLMIQGTGSSVGKSIMVAALCRIMAQDGYRVAPYKSQNMALNSFVTKQGHEMGRAQVVQAEAAGIEPHVDMNPVLIKPEADARSQIVVMGKPFKTLHARDYYNYTPELFPLCEQALNRLRDQYDVVVIEGAGSPAEINLRRFEIVNMAVAKMAQAPVLLVGDIDKGGVFAQLVGTSVLLDDEERALLKGFIINKFRGDASILKPGIDYIEQYSGVPMLGVVPYFHDIVINDEDSIYAGKLSEWDPETGIDIAVAHLPRISNSTDFEPLQQEAGVRLRYIRKPWQLGQPDLIIIPGSKSTISDLTQIKENGLAQAIVEKAKTGTPVIGICGGYQMLGQRINDPGKTESDRDSVEGLGILDIITDFEREKTTKQVYGRVTANEGLFAGLSGETLTGYEIHMGQSRRAEGAAPFDIFEQGASGASHPDGAVSRGGMIFGTYLHGLFDSQDFRRKLLTNIKKGYQPSDDVTALPSKDEQYNNLADMVRQNLDIERIYQICGLK